MDINSISGYQYENASLGEHHSYILPAILKLLESLILDKNIKIDDLILGDKNALIIAARKTGYGAQYETTVVCPQCSNKEKFVFDLDNLKNKEMLDLKDLTLEKTEVNTFLLKLPLSKVVIELKMLTSKDEQLLSELVNDKNDKSSTSFLKTVIVSINGETNKSEMSQFIENMPAVDSRLVRAVCKKLYPDISLSHQFVCKKCEFEEMIEVPLTADFFWPK
jgi:hypothetical protein